MKQPAVAAAPSDEGRGLTTARAVLKVLAFLGRRPDGVRASEVAEEVGKSISTAYYLLASLCEEGFAIHDPHGGLYRWRDRDAQLEPDGVEATDDLAGVVEALFRRTHKRSYLGRVEHGTIEIVAVRGRQGMPLIPGLGHRISDSAHAVAMGKVVLAQLADEARWRYARRGMRPFTPNTITSPEALMAELDQVRRRGFAIEIEEFQEGFCGIAAPILDPRGRFHAVLGLSASKRAYEAEHDQLLGAVVDTAGIPSTYGKPGVSCSTKQDHLVTISRAQPRGAAQPRPARKPDRGEPL
jgi:DNA-binding IclR family transcriptional regulator